LAKPTGLALGLLGIGAVFFHRIFYGPRVPEPEDAPFVETRPRDEIDTARKEQP